MTDPRNQPGASPAPAGTAPHEVPAASSLDPAGANPGHVGDTPAPSPADPAADLAARHESARARRAARAARAERAAARAERRAQAAAYEAGGDEPQDEVQRYRPGLRGESPQRTASTSAPAGTPGWAQGRLATVIFRRGIISVAIIASLLAAVYWLLLASDRYVSESHVIVQRTDIAGGQTMDLGSLLTGGAPGSRADQLLLRDHLQSVDMLRKLDAALGLRDHYSDKGKDFFSRMWRQDASMEWFHRHYLTRTSIEFDDYDGVLVITAQAYDPKKAQAITAMLVQEGERFMNKMAQDLAQAQVSFLEQQVVVLNERSNRARRAVLAYQDRKGLVSPQATAESITAIVARLEAQRTELQTQRSSLLTYLVATHPNVVMLNQQIAAVEKQLEQEQSRLAAPSGRTLNRTVEEFQRLEMEAAFAQDMYRTALVALERGRVEATRTIKKVSALQAPTLPEYAIEPRRWYNTLVFLLVALFLAGVLHLLATIVRDHTD